MATETKPVTQPTHYRFTLRQYEQIHEAGILGEDDRVELIAGEIIDMSPIGARHAACVNALTMLLSGSVGPDAIVSVQNPVELDNDTMPQPDLAVLRDRSYVTSRPTIADILLVIEVSDSTLAYDRNIKLPLYAAAEIAEAWIIDLAAETVERHTEPRDGRYQRTARARRRETLPSTTLPTLRIPVDTIFR